jgi:hypothetical protein
MRRMLVVIGAIATALLAPTCSIAQQQFPGDPLPYTTGPFIFNQFMQLDAVSAIDGFLHTGIDIATASPGADQRVVAPIAYGADCYVLMVGTDFVRLQARDRQGADLAVFEALHITPDASLVQGTYITRNTVIGTVNASGGHLHAGVFLYPGGSACCDDRYLVHPQRNAFATVTTGWNADTYGPQVGATVVHAGAVGASTVFEIHAYDQADMRPSCYNGIYAIRLFVDDNLVDSLRFDRMGSKTGGWPPTADEYYYCTSSACTPTGDNNPSVLQYRLAWTTQSGEHMWRIDVLDAIGNLLHGDPRNGLPGREVPAVSFGGTIEEGKVHLTWRMAAADIEEWGMTSFSVLWSETRNSEEHLLAADPVQATATQESYKLAAEVPLLCDTLYYRLTGLNSAGSILLLGETALAGLPPEDLLLGYPNPARGQYAIALGLSHASTGDVSIFDLNGRRVRTLQRGTLDRGITRWSWDGTSDRGDALPNGVYLLRVSTDDPRRLRTRKVTICR